MGFQESSTIPASSMATVRARHGSVHRRSPQILIRRSKGCANEPPSKEEVERAKTRILKQIELGLTNSETVGLVFSEWAAAGDWRLLFLERDEIAQGHRAGRAARGQGVPQGIQPHAGRVHPHASPRSRRDSANARTSPRCSKEYKGGEVISQGEAFDPTPANIESRVLVPRSCPTGSSWCCCRRRLAAARWSAHDPAVRRREVAVRQERRGAVGRLAAHARHQEQVAPADPGRDRPSEGPRRR